MNIPNYTIKNSLTAFVDLNIINFLELQTLYETTKKKLND